ncbi:MAG: geranylgeranyl reductase family protein [Theionarchaea archaeon]|nr:geranylgeranyl reductase family protein [Theionarchaea archaeon]
MTEESLTRRDFLKRAVLAVTGIVGLSLSRFFKKVAGDHHLHSRKWSSKSTSQYSGTDMKYDVIIVGCGMAGAVAGLTALKNGLSVCIVEKKEREFIGRKICGEMIPESVVGWLHQEFNLSIDCHLLRGLEIRSSSGHASRITEPTCMVNRWKVGQTMLENLLDKGADIYRGYVKRPILESSVKGVETEDSTFKGTVTIDCSGVTSVLRRNLLPEHQVLGLAYKRDLILDKPVEMEYGILLLDKTILPSGYMWCFPKSEYVLNVGVGGMGQSGISLEENLEKAVEALNIKSNVKGRELSGFGLVPLGRPLPSMVYPGFLTCGDAASHVNPLTGGGISPAVTAGYLAANVSKEAVENNDVSPKGLWQYNCDFAKGYGIKHAALTAARDFLVSLSDEELDYFLVNVVSDDDLYQLMRGKIPFQDKGTSEIFLDNWRSPVLLYKMYRAFRLIQRIRSHYARYPGGPEGFPAWRETLDQYLNPHKR